MSSCDIWPVGRTTRPTLGLDESEDQYVRSLPPPSVHLAGFILFFFRFRVFVVLFFFLSDHCHVWWPDQTSHEQVGSTEDRWGPFIVFMDQHHQQLGASPSARVAAVYVATVAVAVARHRFDWTEEMEKIKTKILRNVNRSNSNGRYTSLQKLDK